MLYVMANDDSDLFRVPYEWIKLRARSRGIAKHNVDHAPGTQETPSH